MSQKSAVQIRPARADDMARILEMSKCTHRFQKVTDPVTNTPEQLQKDGGFLSPDDPKLFNVLVAETEIGGKLKLVGYAFYFFAYVSWSGKIGYLQDIYLDEPYRKQGIATRLFNSLSKICLENDCSFLRLQGKFSLQCLLNTV